MAARAGEFISGREARDAGADDPDARRHGRRPPGSRLKSIGGKIMAHHPYASASWIRFEGSPGRLT